MSLKSWLTLLSVTLKRRHWARALALVSLVLVAACTVTTATPAGDTGTGTLALSWTIASSATATQCSAHGAQNIAIQVFNANNLQAGSATASCTAFSATINALPAGSYTVQAQLLDANGGALASLAAPVSAQVQASLITSETVDFPAAAFTTPVAGTGTLELDWTIAASADAVSCGSHGAQSVAIQVFSASNIQYGATTTAPCSALSASIVGLPTGTYTIQAQVLDVNGASISSIVGPLPETITDGLVTKQSIDFPDSSFGTVTTNPNAGSIGVSWTIASGVDAVDCSNSNAASIALQLLDVNNAPVGAVVTAPCSAFTATLPNLTPGTFTLTAKLVDAGGADVTTTATIPNITISAGAVTAQPIDFPSTSFLTSAAGTGAISVSWTIASGTDPTSCTAHGATSLSLQLYQADGVTAIGTAILDPCAAFSATISNLSPGAYALSAQLVNGTGTVSTLIPPQPITVVANTNATQAFDFPSNSF